MTTLTAATPSMGGGLSAAGRMGRPQVQGQAGFAGMTGADFLRIIRQRLLLIIAIWFLVMVGAAISTLLLIKHHPTYLARAYVRIESVEPVNPLQPLESGALQAADLQRVVSDQAVMMKNATVLNQALQEPQLRSTSWYRDAVEKEKAWGVSKLDQLDDAISVSPMKDTSYLVVAARTRKPDEAPTLANIIVDTYMSEVRTRQEEDIRRSKQDLDDELDISSQIYTSILDDLERFRATHDVLGVGTEPNEELQMLIAVETELRLDLGSKESVWETLKNAGPDSPIIPPEIEAMVNQDPLVRAYDAEVLRREQELSALRTSYGVNHRAVKRARDRYDSALRSLNEERADKLITFKTLMIDTARNHYLEAQHVFVKVQDQLENARAKQRDRDADMAEYLSKLDYAELARRNQEQLQQQRDFVNMVLRGKNKLKIERLKAVEPKERHSPKWQYWMPGGAFIGLLLGVGLALLLDMADKSVRTSRDISRHMVIPVLGTIPSSDDDEIEIERVETATIDAPHSIVAEAFRRLRANLFFSAPAEQQGALMVTSPSAGNGKTTISTNLAISIALSGRRVLLIDANFRRPGVPRTFPHDSEHGLSNVLIGRARLDDVVYSTSVPGLDVIGAGPTPPNPAELLGSSYLRDLVVDARSRYDQIIFDGAVITIIKLQSNTAFGAICYNLWVIEQTSFGQEYIQLGHTDFKSSLCSQPALASSTDLRRCGWVGLSGVPGKPGQEYRATIGKHFDEEALAGSLWVEPSAVQPGIVVDSCCMGTVRKGMADEQRQQQCQPQSPFERDGSGGIAVPQFVNNSHGILQLFPPQSGQPALAHKQKYGHCKSQGSCKD